MRSLVRTARDFSQPTRPEADPQHTVVPHIKGSGLQIRGSTGSQKETLQWYRTDLPHLSGIVVQFLRAAGLRLKRETGQASSSVVRCTAEVPPKASLVCSVLYTQG